MKHILLTAALSALLLPAFAQRYSARTARVNFFSATPVENIEAINNEAACALSANTGELQFVVPVKSFKFEKELMQEHFNENYMESDKYPNASFKGKLANMGSINLKKDGTYPATAVGKMTVHGVTRDVSIPGSIIVKGGAPAADATFMIKCSDYGIKIPSVVSSKIAEQIKVTLSAPMTAAK